MINISNCPITGLQRKVTKKNVLFYESTQQLILECNYITFSKWRIN